MSRQPVFIVGRFRSGTTALWNLFRQSPDVFAVYEPLHDQLLAHLSHGFRPDPTHVGVTDYFRELRPHRHTIARYFHREFGATRLAMAAPEQHPAMKAYIDMLIDLAGPKTPVLKFVRADFRLPWLRQNYPDAVILYIWRDAREHWASMVAKEQPHRATQRWLGVYQFGAFAASLALYLPELVSGSSESSYEPAYYLWRISRAIGERYQDLGISFDQDLVGNPESLLRRIALRTSLVVPQDSIDSLLERGLRKRAPALGIRVPFEAIEYRCEEVLERRGLLRAIRAGALDTAWPMPKALSPADYLAAVNGLNLALSEEQGKTLELQATLADWPHGVAAAAKSTCRSAWLALTAIPRHARRAMLDIASSPDRAASENQAQGISISLREQPEVPPAALAIVAPRPVGRGRRYGDRALGGFPREVIQVGAVSGTPVGDIGGLRGDAVGTIRSEGRAG